MAAIARPPCRMDGYALRRAKTLFNRLASSSFTDSWIYCRKAASSSMRKPAVNSRMHPLPSSVVQFKVRKSMRPPITNKISPEANTALVRVAQTNVFNCIIFLPILLVGEAINLSQLVDALNEFDEFAFLDTPLAADLESGQFAALNHAVQRSLRHLQQHSGFLESQKTQRLKISFHRRSAN